MKQDILKRVVGGVALAVSLSLGVVVFGQEGSVNNNFIAPSPEAEPDLFVVPLLDPDVAVVNPSNSLDSSTLNSSVYGGELQKIESSIDVWTKELEQLDVEIMKIQRGGASANIVAEGDESESEDKKNIEENKEKENKLKKGEKADKKKSRDSLKALKDNRKSLIKDIKEAGEKVKSNSGKGKASEDILDSVKSVEFDPNDIIGELDDIIVIADVEAKKQLRKAERVQRRVTISKETEAGREKSEEAQEVEKDTDGDGISDYDEVNIYETDPQDSDSDGDGYSDGLEILVGFNPLDNSASAVIAYESPKNTAVEETDIFSVSKIEVIKTVGSAAPFVATVEPDQILIEGKALPNSFITLYIFSIPTIVTIKTDSAGAWTYILDKEIENGEHELYVATTDNSGKILAKSRAIPFTKEAAAVTVGADLLTLGTETNKEGFFSNTRAYGLGAFFIAVIAGFFMFLGKKKEEKDEFFIG